MPHTGSAAPKATVIDQTYELLLYLVPFLAQYPKTQKYLLADRIPARLGEDGSDWDGW